MTDLFDAAGLAGRHTSPASSSGPKRRGRQSDCPGSGRKVASSWRGPGNARETECSSCGRRVAVNYDGRVRHHVARLAR